MARLLSSFTRVVYHLRGWLYRCLILLAGGRCGAGLRIESGFRLRHGPHAGLSFGQNLYIGCGTVIDCPEGGKLDIGDDVTLTHGAFISVAQSVTVGSDTLIGEYSSIRDANHEIALTGVPIRSQPMRAKPVRIGTDVWIGRGCAILAGSDIGDGSVVGANSVVRGQLPQNVIAAGTPAKVLRERV